MKRITSFILGACALLAQPLFAQSWATPRDADGWSIIQPSSDSRIIYISSTDGNDSTARAYSTAEVGTDPRHPTIAVNAYKTLTIALLQMRDTYPDWLLFKTGDSFPSQIIEPHRIGVGRSASERMVFTYYGDNPNRPVLLTPNFRVWATGKVPTHGGLHHWALIGLEFYHSSADPASPDYNASTSKTEATQILAGGQNLLIEDCKFNYFGLVIQGESNPRKPWINLEIRRNIFLKQYYTGSCANNSSRPSAIYLDHIQNYLLEENMVDYAGWHPDIAGASRNQYNHGFYLQYHSDGELHMRGNIIARAAGNAAQNRSGGLVEKNLILQSPAGLFVAHDTPQGYGAVSGLTGARYNVILEGLSMGNCTTATTANHGMPLHETLKQGTKIEENIVAHNLDGVGTVRGIDNFAQCTYIKNIVYKWGSVTNTPNPGWLDPERSVSKYHATIGGTATTDAFLTVCSDRGVGEWQYEYSAYAVIDYIREGFNLDPIGPGEGEPVDVTDVTVTPESLDLRVGGTSPLTAQVTPSNASDKTVAWSSSDTNVATVSSNGMVTAVAVGTATITATTNDGDFTDTAAITVVQTFHQAIEATLEDEQTATYLSEWLGSFREATEWSGWVLHQNAGWFYPAQDVTSGNVWIWLADFSSWAYTTDTHFPWIHAEADALWPDESGFAWLYLFVATNGHTWYYHTEANTWVEITR